MERRVAAVILASRPGLLKSCLESLASTSPRPAQCLVVLNGRHAECAAAAAPFAERLPGLRLLRAAHLPLGAARNLAIGEAAADWLCFIDDDVVVPPDYFAVLAEKLRAYPQAAAIGGPNLTPSGSPLFERCVGAALASPFCAGPTSPRGAGYPEDAWTDDRGLILCNLAVSRRALLDEGLAFDEELARNEENLLLQQLLRRGRRALHAPRLRVFHRRRADLAGFWRQCFLSGMGRAQMTLKLPSSLRAFHLLPPAVVAGALALAGAIAYYGLDGAPAGVSAASAPLGTTSSLAAVYAGVSLAAVYLAAAAASGLAAAERPAEIPAAAAGSLVIFAAAHVGYACGMAVGFAKTASAHTRAPRGLPFDEAAERYQRTMIGAGPLITSERQEAVGPAIGEPGR